MTTLIATIGSRLDEPADRVATSSGNVSHERGPEPVESLPDWTDALRLAWQASIRRSSIYTLLSVDPLAPVVREWSRRIDGQESELELAIGLLGDAAIPDFYLVDPAISGTVAHWYLDLLPTHAPSRIIVTDPSEDSLVSTLRHLPYGRELPNADVLLEAARHYVPIPKFSTTTLHP